ncbi:MAG: glutathione S-transferase family protein [Alphaproteobacteria bacterium]|nr:glutathione S-transferase family protein [Alphaproteobacteria bacterium]
MKLYYAPISTFSQKVLLAFYEKGIEFEPEIVNLMDPEERAKYRELYPIGKIPLLFPTEDHMIAESSIIVEYLENHYPQGPKLIPDDPDLARQVRFMDRMNDLYLNKPIFTMIFADGKPEKEIEDAKRYIDCSYHHLNSRLENNTWLMGDDFTMADCAAIPPLFYAQKAYPFTDYPNIVAYFARAMERDSYKRVLADALPILKKMGM